MKVEFYPNRPVLGNIQLLVDMRTDQENKRSMKMVIQRDQKEKDQIAKKYKEI